MLDEVFYVAGARGVVAMDQFAPRIDTDENTLAKRLLMHWKSELGKTPVTDEPFQHLYCDRMWPADVYDEILRLLPPHDVYKPMNIKEWVNAEGVSTRDRCFLPETIDRVDEERAGFWRQIWRAMTSESLKRLLFGKFKKDIALRLKMLPDDVANVPAFVSFSLTRDIDCLLYTSPSPRD